ncbi:ABC transporter permease (plasmid) [Cetobacterium somerae]|uniref:ABC transporter permease n=1 Tax=Cetobacterium somerae TaxID=188913 RepID=UPI002E7B8EB7|nr:ABC transporter permease [Cetobacterium somerae]WVJ02713.1 ABC transporter permease [Cetobacterium somerae]
MNLSKNTNLKIGLSIIGVLFFFMILSIFWTPYNPYLIDELNRLKPPSFSHILGTDQLGRDILSRVMVASQGAFYVGFISVLIGGIIGSFLGTISGYFSNWIDEIISKIIDAFMSIPSILFLLVFITIFGKDLKNTAISIGILNIPTFFRISRSKVMEIKNLPYITWARIIGVKEIQIIFSHIFPNILSTLIVVGALSFSTAILTEASLSYLGMGANPPEPTWGEIIYRAQEYITTNQFYAFVPGVLISLVAIGFNLLGEGIKEYIKK